MFEATIAEGGPLTVRCSFWQSFKAGMGFTLGAACVSILAFLLSLLVPGLFVMAFQALLHRLR